MKPVALRHRWIILVATVALVVACAPAFKNVENVTPPPGASVDLSKRVVVLKSSDNPIFDAVVETYLGQIEHPVTIVTMNDEASDRAIAAKLEEHEPDLFLALGTRAALVVRDHFRQVPMVFAMVPAWKAHRLGERAQVAGITMESLASFDFMQFKLAVPDLRRVLVFYNPSFSGPFVKSTRQEVAGHGIELSTVPVAGATDIERAYREYKGDFDAVWLHSDPTVIQSRAFATLKRLVDEDGKVIISSVSDKFAHSGALASVSLDFPGLGSQAAVLTQRLLSDEPMPTQERIQPPIGGFLTVNMEAAKRVGLTVPRDAFPYINRIIGEDTPGKASEKAVEP